MRDSKKLASCGLMSAGLILGVFVAQPLWYILLYQVLARVDAEVWMWVIYWCYCPASILSGFIAGMGSLLGQED